MFWRLVGVYRFAGFLQVQCTMPASLESRPIGELCMLYQYRRKKFVIKSFVLLLLFWLDLCNTWEGCVFAHPPLRALSQRKRARRF